MKKFLKSIALMGLSLTIALGTCMMAACVGNPDPDEDDPNNNNPVDPNPNPDDPVDEPTVYYTVTFDSKGGSEVEAQKVAAGEYATEPDDPTKDEYDFIGWYTDETYTEEKLYSFTGTPVTANITLYAGWEEIPDEPVNPDPGEDEDLLTATFYYNYDVDGNGTVNDAGDVYATQKFALGDRTEKMEDPKRDSFNFGGWYLDTDFETEYNRLKKYEEDINVYAKWTQDYTFEAEKTQLTGLDFNGEENQLAGGNAVKATGEKRGTALSGEQNGVHMIYEAANCSGGKYVAGIDYQYAYLDFEFTSDKAESGISLNIRLSARFRAFTMDDSGQYRVDILVNGVAIKYDEITIDRDNNTQDMDGKDCANYFKTVYLNNIDINEGENLIRILVNNTASRPDGTVRAMAPVVDCIYLKNSSSTLKFKEYTNA